MTDVEKLVELINRALENIEHCDIGTGELSSEFEPLGEAVCRCLSQMQEVCRFISNMADGDLSVPVPSRRNYMAGSSKDLYYKLQHLTWQAKCVADGDYSQRVDFLGDFSDSFNFMIRELEKRENQIQQQAEEQVENIEKQNAELRHRLAQQILHYQAYREYVRSFQDFRIKYKEMMGEVYSLFEEKKYEEGRLLIAKINDMMTSSVVIIKDYSNNDYVNAAIADIADYCQIHEIPFRSSVFIPNDFTVDSKLALNFISELSGFIISLLETHSHSGQSLSIDSLKKNNWMTFWIKYRAEQGDFPEELKNCVCEECFGKIERIRRFADESNNLVGIKYIPSQHKIELALHVSIYKAPANDEARAAADNSL